MLQISAQQIDVFAAQVRERMVRRATSYALETDGGELLALDDDGEWRNLFELSEADLRRVVEAGMDRALRHGLEDEAEQLAFLSLMLAFAPNFDQHPRVAAVLAGPGTAEARLEDLGALPDEVWNEVLAAYDPKAWR